MHGVKMRCRGYAPPGSWRFFLVLLLMPLFSFSAAPLAAAFAIPEKLVYDLTWAGIKAGTAMQEINKVGDEIHIVSTARSADWISSFFPVEDRIESVLTGANPPGIGLPRSYRMKIREGRHSRDREVLFDQVGKISHYRNHLSGEKMDIALPGSTFDTLSSFLLREDAQAGGWQTGFSDDPGQQESLESRGQGAAERKTEDQAR